MCLLLQSKIVHWSSQTTAANHRPLGNRVANASHNRPQRKPALSRPARWPINMAARRDPPAQNLHAVIGERKRSKYDTDTGHGFHTVRQAPKNGPRVIKAGALALGDRAAPQNKSVVRRTTTRTHTSTSQQSTAPAHHDNPAPRRAHVADPQVSPI